MRLSILSSLHWLFHCFLCRFSSNGAYSEWTSPFCKKAVKRPMETNYFLNFSVLLYKRILAWDSYHWPHSQMRIKRMTLKKPYLTANHAKLLILLFCITFAKHLPTVSSFQQFLLNLHFRLISIFVFKHNF